VCVCACVHACVFVREWEGVRGGGHEAVGACRTRRAPTWGVAKLTEAHAPSPTRHACDVFGRQNPLFPGAAEPPELPPGKLAFESELPDSVFTQASGPTSAHAVAHGGRGAVLRVPRRMHARTMMTLRACGGAHATSRRKQTTT